ncbi:MAG: dephospho-CoA kinase [Oscillospiraceae bacterium]
MKIIGITGGTGAGKTTALRFLADMGAFIIDCDALYHQLLINDSSLKAELENRFPGILENGRIDTKMLGGRVFGDPEALADLNDITHKYVIDEVGRRIREQKSLGRAIVAIDAVALIESGLGDMCNRIVGVIAPSERRLSRIMARDSISEEYALSRIQSQKQDEFYINNCDMILENDYDDIKSFYGLCEEFLTQLLEDIKPEEEL